MKLFFLLSFLAISSIASADVLVTCQDRDRLSVTVTKDKKTLKGVIERSGDVVAEEVISGYVEDDQSIVFRSNKRFNENAYNWYLTLNDNMNSFEALDNRLLKKLEPVLNLRLNGLKCSSDYSKKEIVQLLIR